MEIKGKIHCFFEQSGTFKKEFMKLGYEAYDYDIQNNFNETDYIMDLFAEIEKGYDGKPSLFDSISKDDLIIAFFPCIYFEAMSMIAFSWGCKNYRKLSIKEKSDKIIERANNRLKFYTLLIKMVTIAEQRGLRLVFENPWNEQHYLKQGNFVKSPSVIDMNRRARGDYFLKPTAYWFFNCEPTHGFTHQHCEEENFKTVYSSKASQKAGLCSEERSMISTDYARNWICDFILGKEQEINEQIDLF